MNSCIKCGLELYYQNLCRKCFCNSIEKKVSKEVTSKLKKDDVILVINDGSDLSRLNWHFLKLFSEKVPCCIAYDNLDKIVKKTERTDEKSKNTETSIKLNILNVKVITPENMDDELRRFLNSLEKGDLKKFLETENSSKTINILRTLSEQECYHYARARKMKYLVRKEQDELMNMINKIELKYSGRKMGMIKTIRELRKIFDNDKK